MGLAAGGGVKMACFWNVGRKETRKVSHEVLIYKKYEHVGANRLQSNFMCFSTFDVSGEKV